MSLSDEVRRSLRSFSISKLTHITEHFRLLPSRFETTLEHLRINPNRASTII